MILGPHGSLFKKIDFEIEAFALEIILEEKFLQKSFP
jgi:hypothetical protein